MAGATTGQWEWLYKARSIRVPARGVGIFFAIYMYCVPSSYLNLLSRASFGRAQIAPSSSKTFTLIE